MMCWQAACCEGCRRSDERVNPIDSPIHSVADGLAQQKPATRDDVARRWRFWTGGEQLPTELLPPAQCPGNCSAAGICFQVLLLSKRQPPAPVDAPDAWRCEARFPCVGSASGRWKQAESRPAAARLYSTCSPVDSRARYSDGSFPLRASSLRQEHQRLAEGQLPDPDWPRGPYCKCFVGHGVRSGNVVYTDQWRPRCFCKEVLLHKAAPHMRKPLVAPSSAAQRVCVALCCGGSMIVSGASRGVVYDHRCQPKQPAHFVFASRNLQGEDCSQRARQGSAWDRCPLDCGGVGKCLDGFCHCPPGRWGADCGRSQASTNTSGCNTHFEMFLSRAAEFPAGGPFWRMP